MRTTLDLDSHLMQRLRRKALEEGKSLKETINHTLARGLDEGRPESNAKGAYKIPTYAMGKPLANLDKALQVADEMEDYGTVNKLEMRK